MNDTIEYQFHEAMTDIYKNAKRECNYTAKRFLGMLSEFGGLQTAKRLLGSQREVQYGFGELWRCGRLDLTVEAHVLRDEFIDLFEKGERQEAERRLLEHDPSFFNGKENDYSRWLSER